MNSRFKAHQVPTTEQRDQFNTKKKDWKLSKPTRLDRYGSRASLNKTDYNAEFKQKIKSDWGLLSKIDAAVKEEEAMMRSTQF